MALTCSEAVRAVPTTCPVLLHEPAMMSGCVRACVPAHRAVPPGARVTAVHGVRPVIVVVTPSSVVLPVLVAV